MQAKEILSAAIKHMDDRAKQYDAPDGERSMARTVKVFNAYTDLKLTEEQGWLFMSVLKVVRSLQGGFNPDDHEDEAAYAALRGECIAKNRLKELEEQLEAIGAGGVTSGQKLIRRT